MTGKTILIVDDEAPIRQMVSLALERAGYVVLQAADASEALLVIHEQLPDLVLLDWMMPAMSGIELARRLRRDDYTRELPIILLTARGEEDDRIHGFDAGADDYITKPFSPRELLARIRAVLRRSIGDDGEGVIEFQAMRLDGSSHRITIGDSPLKLGPTEFRLLQFFLSHPERVYSRGQLLDMVWGRGTFIEERTVDVHIRRLRKELEPSGYDRYIQTVRSAGYRFSEESN